MEISEDELRRLVDAAVDEDPDGLMDVARVRPDLVAPFHLRLVEAQVWWPADLYRGMTEETAAVLVQRIEAAGRQVGLVSALAAGGTETAVAAIRRWAADPPPWAEHMSLARVGHAGGWELDDDGVPRALTSPVATELVPLGRAAAGAAPLSGGALDARCEWCGLALWRLLETDLSLLGDKPGRALVATCVRCGCYTPAFFTEQGRFAAENERPDFLGNDDDSWDLPDGPALTTGPPRPTPFAGIAWEAGGSTLGGAPDWIQDPAYPTCPRCHRTMPYLGMITGSDLWSDSGEGCHYLFHDRTCALSAAVYQQS